MHVVDSTQLSGGQALLVLYAAGLAKEGHGAAEICRLLAQTSEHIRTTFVLPGASIFYQRGYTNRFLKHLCEVLNLHPLLHMDESAVKICGFLWGNLENAWKWYIRILFLNRGRIDPQIVYISHVGLSVRQLEFVESEVKKYVKFDQVVVEKASVSNACNAGIGTLGISYVRR